jgi:hypothetical protein
MPIRIEYTSNETGVILYHEGVVTGKELHDSVSRVYKDSRYPNLKYWIGDRSNCLKFLPDEYWLQKIVDLNKTESSRNPGMLLALVSPKVLEFGMSRMFQVYSGESLFKTEVFKDRGSAEKWIKEALKLDAAL